MTEAEWLVCGDPGAMLDHLGRRADARKLRLFACACADRLQSLRSPDARRRSRRVRTAERLADGRFDLHLVRRLKSRFGSLGSFSSATFVQSAGTAAVDDDAGGAARGAVAAAEFFFPVLADERGFEATGRWPEKRPTPAAVAASAAGLASLADLLRDIFGSPFRPAAPAALDPARLSPEVVGLARAIYDGRAFDRMPELADALMRAGCADADVLGHCRGPGPHVRGCWVVDAILGKG